MAETETVDPAIVYASALAQELGEGWKAQENRNRWRGAAVLLGPGGEEISVRLGSEQSYSLAAERGRVLMHGIIPAGLRGFFHGPSPEITVSRQKPAATVAKELRRRLLDGYQLELANARELKRDYEEREAERAALVEQAAAELEVLGPVNVHDRDRRHGDPNGKLSLGEYRSRVRVQLEVERLWGAKLDDRHPPLAKAQVEVHRDLLPQLTAALASLAEDAPQCAGDAPAWVWVVHRADTDALEAFEDEWRAKQYAEFFEGATYACCQVMSCSAAGQFFIDTVHDLPGDEPDVE